MWYTVDVSAILRHPLSFVSCLHVGPSWDFIYEVLDLSMKVLSPCGWLRTLVKNSGDREAIALYKQQVKRLSCPVELSQEEVYITSYHENWVIYKIWKKWLARNVLLFICSYILYYRITFFPCRAQFCMKFRDDAQAAVLCTAMEWEGGRVWKSSYCTQLHVPLRAEYAGNGCPSENLDYRFEIMFSIFLCH